MIDIKCPNEDTVLTITRTSWRVLVPCIVKEYMHIQIIVIGNCIVKHKWSHETKQLCCWVLWYAWEWEGNFSKHSLADLLWNIICDVYACNLLNMCVMISCWLIVIHWGINEISYIKTNHGCYVVDDATSKYNNLTENRPYKCMLLSRESLGKKDYPRVY